MSRRTLLSLLMLFAMILAPAAALAQDGDEEMETYTSSDGLLTFSYPAGWSVLAFNKEEMGPPFPLVVFSPSEETIDRLNMEEDFLEGQYAMAVVILPTAIMSLTGEPLPEEPTPGDYAGVAAQMFFGAFEEAPAEGAGEMAEPTEEATKEAEGEMAEATEEAMMGGLTVGEPEEVELGDMLTGGLVTLLSDTDEGVVVARQLADDLIAVTLSASYPGEFTDELRQMALDINASVEYTGTADALMAAMMAAPQGEVEPSDVDPATLDGNALIDERCTVCHTRERIDQQDKDEAGWTATVDRMISYGADLDEAERQAVINYLVETH